MKISCKFETEPSSVLLSFVWKFVIHMLHYPSVFPVSLLIRIFAYLSFSINSILGTLICRLHETWWCCDWGENSS